jgi:multiple antibiotic resistance protein
MSIVSFGILCFSSLFTVIDPIATAPVFASMTSGASREHVRQIAVRACLVAFGVLILFAVSGAFVFRMFGITIDAFRIGGGIVFLGIGLPMLTGGAHEARPGAPTKDPSVVPLGVPLIGGPGAITTVMVLMGQSSSAGHVVVLLAALVFALVATCAVLLVSPAIMRRLGAPGLELVTKVMGLIILVIGVQFIIDGVRPVAVDILRSARG